MADAGPKLAVASAATNGVDGATAAPLCTRYAREGHGRGTGYALGHLVAWASSGEPSRARLSGLIGERERRGRLGQGGRWAR